MLTLSGIVVVGLMTLGFVFLARDAEATGWLRKAIKRRAEEGRSPTSACYNIFSRFLDSMLECSPCVSAYASMLAVATYWAIGQVNEIASGAIILLVIGPVGAVGLLYGFTLLSPSQAMAAALAGLGRLGKGKADAAKKDTTG